MIDPQAYGRLEQKVDDLIHSFNEFKNSDFKEFKKDNEEDHQTVANRLECIEQKIDEFEDMINHLSTANDVLLKKYSRRTQWFLKVATGLIISLITIEYDLANGLKIHKSFWAMIRGIF